MRICMVRHAYFPDDPLNRKQVLALLEAGHSVDIVCLRKEGQTAHEKFKGADVWRIPLRHKRRGIVRYLTEYFASCLMMSIVTFCLFLRHRYACIQVSTMPDVLVFVAALPKLFGAKVLLDLHEPTPELWITKYGPERLSLLLRLQTRIEQTAVRFADRCITVTESLRCRFGERGADTGKITVIPNVCEETTFHYDPAAETTSPNGEFVLVTHGLIEERYGHQTVVRAVSSLKDRLPGLRFEILGDGEYRQAVAALVRQLGCEDRVHFTGFVSTERLLERLRAADAGIVAMQRSPYSELIDTNKMYEYMALRKPVVISRLQAVEDNFDESCVMFFEPGNHEDLARCILELERSVEKRVDLAENASRRYEEVRWEKTKQVYLSVFDDLVIEPRELVAEG